ncbi:MAG TPA: tRNA (guanosine(37)-N1)-methyltransferase TrmD [Rhizomicrobium sp.]|nr:tRNA (guanosine(37)-N1)-methyltransferase TrmD [Rhizomicrobium sp.]
MTWKATVLTLFPAMFPGPLDVSLIGQARAGGLWSLEVRDIRDHGLGRHRTVDDTPAGGGPGMVMRADVAAAAIDAARAGNPRADMIYLSPRGARLDQRRVRTLAGSPGILLLCGRFEGLDHRIVEARGLEELSIGDFVLAGGEIAAMALIEACVRLLPGVLGCQASGEQESFEGGLLEYAHYTRPAEFEGRAIPPVLLSGHHEEIARWRRAEAEALTRARRPDLWSLYESRRR